MKNNLTLKHLRDIMILPGVVIGVIPRIIYKYTPEIIPGYWTIKIFASIILLIGILLFCWTIFLFNHKAKGTLAPWSSKKEFITTGPYKYVRNPMIIGVVFILIAEGLLSRSIPILIWAKLFLFINLIYISVYEEKFLEKKFGTVYTEYKKKVPGWVPKL